MRDLLPLTGLLLGQIVLFIGERLLGEGHELRLAFSGAGALLAAGALGLRLWHLKAASGERRAILRRLCGAYGVTLVGLLIYGASIEEGPLGLAADSDLRVALSVGWIIVWFCGLVPALFMELSLRSMEGAERLETRRVFDSGRAGLVVALAAAWLGVLNYVGAAWDQDVDMRTIKAMTPSGSTVKIASAMNEPVEVLLFFPPANEVGQRVAPYFEALDEASEMITVRQVDQEADPTLAEQMTVRRNGTVVLSLDEDQREKIILSTEERTAERMLKRLDSDVQRKLSRLSRGERVAYFVSGHGERARKPRKKGDVQSLKAFTDYLGQQNYRVKTLGVSEGLSEKVPDNATIVLLVGPKGPLLDAEVESLVDYVEGGGSLLVMLDPEVDKPLNLEPLLSALGVEVELTRLANETRFAVLSGGIVDRAILYTRRVSRHGSTATLSKVIRDNNLIFPVTGAVAKAPGAKPPADGGPDVQLTVRAVGGTFADDNRNFRFDEGSETKKDYALTAAVELPAPADAGEADKAEGEEGPRGGRAIVTADADLVTDIILAQSVGNQQWAADGLLWLEGEEDLSGEVASPEDVKIVHTKDEDKAWFYGTVMGVPLLVLGAGIGVRAIRRRRRRDEA